MIKRLAGCIRQYKRDTVLTPLFMLGEVSCECVIPLLTAELINNIQAGCAGIYTIRCRIFRSQISTASPRRLS